MVRHAAPELALSPADGLQREVVVFERQVVLDLVEDQLRAALPLRADRILNRIREVRGGKLNESEFGKRMSGTGPYWDMVVQSFKLHCRKLGFNERSAASETTRKTFRRPSAQGTLFE